MQENLWPDDAGSSVSRTSLIFSAGSGTSQNVVRAGLPRWAVRLCWGQRCGAGCPLVRLESRQGEGVLRGRLHYECGDGRDESIQQGGIRWSHPVGGERPDVRRHDLVDSRRQLGDVEV